jgi:anti-anti-sigma factor
MSTVAQQTALSTVLVAERHHVDAHAVVELHGELDLAAADELECLLVSSSVDGAEHVTVDLGDVTFAACAGLHALQCSQDHLRSSGVGFGLRSVGPRLLRLLQLTGTVGAFEVESDREVAVTRLGGGL